MAKNNFLMLDLDDPKTKRVANIVGNETCRKILNLLAEGSSTESGLSKRLKIPISTVHYNIQQLMEAGLIIADEFHYSDKGKEVNHYRLANRYIIITPKKVYGIKQKLRSILPALGISALAAAALHIWSGMGKSGTAALDAASGMKATLSHAAGSGAAEAAARASNLSANAALPAPESGTHVATSAVQQHLWQISGLPGQEAYLWFLAGAIFALAAYLLIAALRKR